MKHTKRKPEISPLESGRISSAVIDLLLHQVDDLGIVVWYDPQKAYGHLIKRLTIADCDILQLGDGFFRLREQLEPFLECVNEDCTLKPDADIPPRVIVYVPMARTNTGFALIEAESAGCVVEPDATVAERNSRLGHIVEMVFKKIAPPKAAHLARQADDGLLTVEELDRMAGEAGGTVAGALQIVFGNVPAEEMLIQFAAQANYDADLMAKSAIPEILALCKSELGLEVPPTEDCSLVRGALTRHLFVGELLLGIKKKDRPEALSGMAEPHSPSQCDIISRICRQWRNRIDLKDSYSEAAERIEEELGFSRIAWPVSELKDNETFLFAERILLNYAVELFLHGDSAAAAELAKQRSSSFWSNERPVWQLAWRVVDSASGLVMFAENIRSMLGKQKWPLDDLIDAYVSHSDPWMRLDRLSRELETRNARWEAAVTDQEIFEPLMAKSREVYATTAGMLAEAYVSALRQAKFASGRHSFHGNVFHDHVMPELEANQKVAFFMVDALRYEMAVELIDGLKAEFEAKVTPVLGGLPGITSVGMAMLLPGAQNSLHLIAASSGLDVKIQEKSIAIRSKRLEWLATNAGVPVCSAKLSDTLKPTFRRRKDFEVAKLIVVTSQEIDSLGEEGDEEGIRLYLEDVLEKLRRAIRKLSKAGVNRFIVAADHGFIYAQGSDPGLTMDAPGGKTVLLHPRVWIGEGGASGHGFFRVKASELALGGSLELAFPLGLGAFRVKGGVPAYFHGGISPAENILPVVRIIPAAKPISMGTTIVKITMSKTAITNRLFSVTIEMKSEGLFVEEGRRLRFELVSGQNDAGRIVAAAYGFEDGTSEVTMKTGQPNAVTFMLNVDIGPKVTICVLDCQSQVVLDTLKDIPVKLGM